MEENHGEITLMDALPLRMNMGSQDKNADVGPLVTNGKWLSGLLRNLRDPGKIRRIKVPSTVHAELRPYQKDGYIWLNYMDRLGFGACLADDMGLGKTLQVLAYLERMRKTKKMPGYCLSFRHHFSETGKKKRKNLCRGWISGFFMAEARPYWGRR